MAPHGKGCLPDKAKQRSPQLQALVPMRGSRALLSAQESTAQAQPLWRTAEGSCGVTLTVPQAPTQAEHKSHRPVPTKTREQLFLERLFKIHPKWETPPTSLELGNGQTHVRREKSAVRGDLTLADGKGPAVGGEASAAHCRSQLA